MKLRHLDLFSGIGGFSLGMEATGGFETVAFCEIEEYPRKVLQKHWPYVKRYEDIKELTYERLKADGLLPIHIVTGGYPCQPFSNAGRKRGESDPRHLWPEMFRVIKELRPTWVVGENVPGHIKLGLDSVLSDLADQGYSARTFSVSASSVGANHKRERIWIVADTLKGNVQAGRERRREIREGHQEDGFSGDAACGSEDMADTERIGQQGQGKPVRSSDTKKNQNGKTSWTYDGSQGSEGWWDIEPDVGRVAHGIPGRVDRLKGLGNSLIPQIPFYLGQSILKTYSEDEDEKTD